MTIPEIVSAAGASFAAGADALHAHVRDAGGRHALDAGLYRELIAEMARDVPGMPVQITTEAMGLYAPREQRALVQAVEPEGVSVSLREMCPGGQPDHETRRFYERADESGLALQHILYSPKEVSRLATLAKTGDLPDPRQVLFVLGSYDPPRLADPAELDSFLAAARQLPEGVQWAACAFGRTEKTCLLHALRSGGCARIGFENNIQKEDGTLAFDNADQVSALMRSIPQEPGC